MENQIKAPPQVRAVADFLRSSKAGIKLRVGVMNGKRLDYFKGMCLSFVCVQRVFFSNLLIMFVR